VLGWISRIPIFRLLLIAELVLVVREHYLMLEPSDRLRLRQLVARGPRLTPAERRELRGILGKLEPALLAGAAVKKLSPVPLPDRLTGEKKRKALVARRPAGPPASA
jgi:hypothetical protein